MTRDLDTDAAALALSLTPGTIRDMCAAGKLKGAYRIGGGRWRIPTWKEAHGIVQHLEDVAENAIQKAARKMNPVVEELTRVAKVAVVVFGLLGFGAIAVQIIRAVF